jgi:hypothetical protein
VFGRQQFAAKQTFEAIFGESVQPFRGGGVDVVVYRNFFAELGFSRFERTGERVFRSGDEIFRLGIPLTATIAPIELSGGYRMTEWRRVIPYGGVGFGSYHYQEESDFSAAGENVDVSKKGVILVAGAEVRVARWVGVAVDVRKTTIDDIIGSAGISKEFGETNLGGTAFRFRVMRRHPEGRGVRALRAGASSADSRVERSLPAPLLHGGDRAAKPCDAVPARGIPVSARAVPLVAPAHGD